MDRETVSALDSIEFIWRIKLTWRARTHRQACMHTQQNVCSKKVNVYTFHRSSRSEWYSFLCSVLNSMMDFFHWNICCWFFTTQQNDVGNSKWIRRSRAVEIFIYVVCSCWMLCYVYYSEVRCIISTILLSIKVFMLPTHRIWYVALPKWRAYSYIHWTAATTNRLV